MISRKFLILASTLMLLSPLTAQADNVGIAATVNDDIISTLDLDNRVRLVIGMTGLTDSPETRANLRPQILRSLVDEKLQLQEAQRSGVNISEKDMDNAIATIERQNGRPPGSFDQYLEQKGLPKQSFLQQVKAQLSWSKLVGKKVRGHIKISDTEISQNSARLAAKQKNKTNGDSASSGGAEAMQVQISTISLPVYSPQNDASARKLADKLSKEISSGAKFEAVAAQFTGEGADATTNNALWVTADQLDPVIAKGIAGLKPGQVSAPLHTASGYQIVKLLDMRKEAAADSASESNTDSELALKQIVLTLKPDAKRKEVDVLMQIAKEVAKNPGKCTDKGIAGMTPEDMDAANIDISRTRVRISQLAPDLLPVVQELQVGQVSEPFATEKGIHLLMLCERIEIPASYVDKDAVRDTLYTEKAELEAAKYMRNLRREAFIDIRG